MEARIVTLRLNEYRHAGLDPASSVFERRFLPPPTSPNLGKGILDHFALRAVQNDGTAHQPQPPTVTFTSFFAE